jgi:hypothetical protein
MNQVIEMLIAFVVLGLFAERLKKWTYILMGVVIIIYVAYAYNH